MKPADHFADQPDAGPTRRSSSIVEINQEVSPARAVGEHTTAAGASVTPAAPAAPIDLPTSKRPVRG